MSREIKFRAWDGQEMYYEANGYDVGITNLNTITKVIEYAYPIQVSEDGDAELRLGRAEDVVLMQLTGLTDKKGKEIYEGDILEIQTPFSPQRYYVDYYNGAYRSQDPNAEKDDFKGEIGYWHGDVLEKEDVWDVEVIGNKFENKEMLKEVE